MSILGQIVFRVVEELLKVSFSIHVLHLCKITIYGFNLAKHDINLPQIIERQIRLNVDAGAHRSSQQQQKGVFWEKYIVCNMLFSTGES